MASAGRYAAASHDSRSAPAAAIITSDHHPYPKLRKNLSSLRKLLGGPGSRSSRGSGSPRSASPQSLPRPRSAGELALSRPPKNDGGSMVKRLMGKKSKPEAAPIALQLARDDLKKVVAGTVADAGGGSNLSGLSKKLFQRSARPAKAAPTEKIKALCEVKENTRTLGMVLRSERDLLNQNKAYEDEIAELRLVVEERDRELDKLKKMCLKQREEIDALRNSVVARDAKFHGVQELGGHKVGFEVMQAKDFIPSLEEQVKLLKMQLRCFAEDLAEVKSSQRSQADRHTYGDASSSWASCDPVTPTRSLDEMYTKDLNPCLTPYDYEKSKEFLPICFGSREKGLSENIEEISGHSNSNDHTGGLFMNSESCQSRSAENARSVIWKSSQNRFSKFPIPQKFF